MRFDIVLDELKDPYEGMRSSDKKKAIKKAKDDKDHEKREKEAFEYAVIKE